MAAIAVWKHCEIGWSGPDSGVNLFGRAATLSSGLLFAGMVTGAVIAWFVQDCERTATALALSNLRNCLFAAGFFVWLRFITAIRSGE